MEICGGAREVCDERSLVAAVSAFKSMMRSSIFDAKADAIDGCGCADWEVHTPRPQSWLQQLLLRTMGSFPSPSAP